MQGVKPATGLTDVFNDEVAGEVRLGSRPATEEPLGVLERKVDLPEGHRAGVEPDVEDILDPAHR